MPEKVTRQEKIISLAIEKARKAKEELSAKQRKNIEPTQVLEIDTDPEVEKIKRPKVQDASKITNQTQKKEGYGLAGESLKKQDELDTRRKEQDKMILSGFKKRAKGMIARAKQVRNEAADLYNQDGEFGFDKNMKKLNDAIQEYIKDIEEVEKR